MKTVQFWNPGQVSVRRPTSEIVRAYSRILSAVAARLPGPPPPTSPPPRFRPRAVLEVVLLAGALGVVVLQRLADVDVVTLPAWWPLG